MDMNTSSLMTAPMVRIRPRAPAKRLNVEDALALARLERPDWWWLYERQGNPAIQGAIDPDVVAELLERAPNDFLAGYVSGLAINKGRDESPLPAPTTGVANGNGR
ncbi:MAG: hypothetical protein ABI702_03505 [Burkholderiales bacterium]